MTQDSSAFRVETVQELEQHGAFAPSLGSIISWGLKNIVIPEGDLRQLLNEHDLQDVKIPAIRKRKALNRALKEMVEDELIRLLADTKEKIVYVLVKISNDVDLEEVHFNRTLKVTYRKDAQPGTDPLTFSSGVAEQVLRPLIDKYQTSYVSSDISRFILLPTVKLCGGIPLRPEGGMYFVPATAREVVMQLRAFAESLGKRQNALAYLSMFNVIDDADAKQDMQRHAHDALKAELRDLGHLLAKLLSNPERSVRATTVEKHLEEAERIAQEASLYRDLILLQAEDITAELDTLRRQFRAVVQGEATFGDEVFAGTTHQGTPAPNRVQDDPGF
jgi:Family of unknown function (DUF6744)